MGKRNEIKLPFLVLLAKLNVHLTKHKLYIRVFSSGVIIITISITTTSLIQERSEI